MQIFHHIRMGTLLEQAEPRIHLLADSLGGELVALQSLGPTSGGVGVARRSMSNAHNAINLIVEVYVLQTEARHAVTV